MNTKLVVGCLIGTLFVGSVIARAVIGGPEERPAAASTGTAPPPGSPNPLLDGGTNTLVPGGPTLDGPRTSPPPTAESEGAGEGGGAADALPIVTEASFFGMLGFALGYAARKVVKLAMLFVALFFVLLQGLSYAQIVAIDWDRAVQVLNDFVLNLKQNQTIGEVLRDRIPTAGSLVAGYFLGFRRG